jgi:phage terminase large subunit
MFPENGGRVGTYFHLFPTYAQGKKIIWDGIDKAGFKVLDHFPHQLIKSQNETELQVELINGSIYQIIGTDKIDSIVGTNPVGCVFSEFSLQNPKAWDLISPILLENGGWATFNFTPRGHNHAEGLYKMAQHNADWYCTKFTIDDTTDADGNPVISAAAVESERARMLAQGRSESDVESFLQQEYYCSFEGFQEGSYYAANIRDARAQGRITKLPWISELPVFTFWDIGIGDATAIWFGQIDGRWLNFIDYYENSGEGLAHYVKHLKSKPYVYDRHYWPHDGGNRVWAIGETGRTTGESLGLRPIDIVPRGGLEEGIEAVRGKFSRCRFDEVNCDKGLNCLISYHKERDDERQEFKLKPYHDWSSNGADAFRTMAKSDWETAQEWNKPITVNLGFDARNQPDVIGPQQIRVNTLFDARR